jgi:hypothetical protein
MADQSSEKRMNGAQRNVWFLGDLDDPWVGSILKSISSQVAVHAVMCAGDVPERPYDPLQPPEVVVLHRSRLSQADVVALARWNPEDRSNTLPKIILCFSPYVRYEELEQCGPFVERAVGEATAAEVLSHHLASLVQHGEPTPRIPASDRAPVRVLSSDHGLRSVVTEACISAGFRVIAQRDPCPRGDSPDGLVDRPVLTVYDVPVLEPAWPELLYRQCRLGPVVALLGFADRVTVAQAKAAGSSACLDLPQDLDDLIHVLDRLSLSIRPGQPNAPGGRAEAAHLLPRPPVGRVRRGRAAILDRPPRLPRWPEADASPRIKQTDLD